MPIEYAPSPKNTPWPRVSMPPRPQAMLIPTAIIA